MITTGEYAVKDLQVNLAESRLYNSAFDGVWGGGSTAAVKQLFDHAASVRNVASPSASLAGSTSDNIVQNVQTALSALGLYTGTADGIMGDGTTLAFYRLNKEYRQANNLPEYKPCWSNKVNDEFIAAVQQWCDSVGFGLRGVYYTLNIMGFESGGTYNPAKQNMAGAQAFGLLQFMAPAAADMGTTVDALKQMSQLDQLQYVFKYFNLRMKQYGKFTRLDDFYLSVFYPKAIGKSSNEIIFVQGAVGYTQNNGLDLNHDGNISVGEIGKRIYDYYYQGMQLVNRRTA